MGKTETPAPPWKQLGFTKIIFNEPKMPLTKCSSFLDWPKNPGKNGALFSRTFWIV